MVGKWHLGIGFATTDGAPVDRAANGANVDYTQPLQDGPTHHGFDYYYGDDVPNFPPYAFIENDRFPEIPDRPFEAGMPGVPGVMAKSWQPEKLLATETAKRWNTSGSTATDHSPDGQPDGSPHAHRPVGGVRRAKSRRTLRRFRRGDRPSGRRNPCSTALRATRDRRADTRGFSSDNGSSFQDGGTNDEERYGGRFGSILDMGHNPSGHFRG